MKKFFYLTGLMLLAVFTTLAQTPVLKFNADKKFRIMQFTDLHFRGDSYRSDSVLVMVKIWLSPKSQTWLCLPAMWLLRPARQKPGKHFQMPLSV